MKKPKGKKPKDEEKSETFVPSRVCPGSRGWGDIWSDALITEMKRRLDGLEMRMKIVFDERNPNAQIGWYLADEGEPVFSCIKEIK